METVLDMALSTVSSLDEAFTSGVPLLSEEVEAEQASSEKPDVEKSKSASPAKDENGVSKGENIEDSSKTTEARGQSDEEGGEDAGSGEKKDSTPQLQD